MYLFFDTETTGVPLNFKAPVTDLRNWPRMVQLAWCLVDSEGECLSTQSMIIRPDGFTIPSEVARIHGIDTRRAQEEGIALDEALAHIIMDLAKTSVIVAHNIAFDSKILGAEFLRCKLTNSLVHKQHRCTMEESTNFCALPSPRGGYKWPKLEELYFKLFRTRMEGAHDAMNDVEACMDCFYELQLRGLIA